MEITILNHTDKKDGVHWQFGQDIQLVITKVSDKVFIQSWKAL